ncbi:DMT family transporter, partial [Micromonospora globispora]|uniref:DMT family transporter n=1 Tax=Micromonospora globispora TaxID=1450148 RepID=UPI000FABFB7C
MRPLPAPAALAMVVLGGVAAAAQGAINAELGERAGNPVLGAVVNNLGGSLLVAIGLLAVPSMRAGLAEGHRVDPAEDDHGQRGGGRQRPHSRQA